MDIASNIEQGRLQRELGEKEDEIDNDLTGEDDIVCKRSRKEWTLSNPLLVTDSTIDSTTDDFGNPLPQVPQGDIPLQDIILQHLELNPNPNLPPHQVLLNIPPLPAEAPPLAPAPSPDPYYPEEEPLLIDEQPPPPPQIIDIPPLAAHAQPPPLHANLLPPAPPPPCLLYTSPSPRDS